MTDEPKVVGAAPEVAAHDAPRSGARHAASATAAAPRVSDPPPEAPGPRPRPQLPFAGVQTYVPEPYELISDAYVNGSSPYSVRSSFAAGLVPPRRTHRARWVVALVILALAAAATTMWII